MRTNKRLPLVILMVLAVVLLPLVQLALAQSGYVVDPFSAWTQNLYVAGTGPTQHSNAAGDTEPTILGGERDAVLTFSSGTGSVNAYIANATYGEIAVYAAAGSSPEGTLEIVWDGNDGDATTLNADGLCTSTGCTGGTGKDLTQGSTRDGFHLRVLSADQDFGFKITVYTGDNYCSEYSQTETTPISAPGKSYFIRFSPDFAQCSGASGQATFSNAGAVVLLIDGTVEAKLDVEIEFIETQIRDFGDLPQAYNNVEISPLDNDDGARHIIDDLWLGDAVDGENNGQESVYATDDGADEDGVTPTGNWSDGNGHVTVDVSGGRGCLMGWLDFWNGSAFGSDNDFGDTHEVIINNQPVNTGDNYFNFFLPDEAANDATMYARFRLVPDLDDDGDCAEQASSAPGLTGEAYNGEVEDYWWEFGPTAVTLRNLEARPSGLGWAALALVVAGLLVGAMTLLTLTRRRKA